LSSHAKVRFSLERTRSKAAKHSSEDQSRRSRQKLDALNSEQSAQVILTHLLT